jgi:hypothetical protein
MSCLRPSLKVFSHSSIVKAPLLEAYLKHSEPLPLSNFSNLRQRVSNKAQPFTRLSLNDILENVNIKMREVPYVEAFPRLDTAVVAVDMQKEAFVDSFFVWVVD